MFNHKRNAEEHIIQQKKKTEAAYQTIQTIMGNQHFNNIELETACKLLETCIIRYGGETWEMTKQGEKIFNQIQENIIRRIRMIPQSTRTESRYIETGLLHITTIVTINRLNMEKKLHKHHEKLTSKIMELNKKNGWKDTNEIKYKKNQMESWITTQIHEIIDPPRGINDIQSKNQNVARKKTFRGKYKDTKCRKCPDNIETQEHVLETCPGIHTDLLIKIPTN